MADKTFVAYTTTGKTVYGIIERIADLYRLDDSDGSFAAAPADPYVSFTEHTVIKGEYGLTENRTVWNDGIYKCVMYEQAGGSPAPASDMVIAYQYMYTKDDAEVVNEAIISTDIVSANPAYMHDPLIDQANIIVAQVGLIRNKPSAAPIQIAEITTPGLIKVWRYRKGTDADWTLIVAGGGMSAAIGGIYFQYTFPSASWQTGDLILYEIYNTVVTLGTEVFTLSTVQGFGMIGTVDPQVIRDAMKLAPTAGDPAAGSIDKHLDTIETDTNEIQGKLPTNYIMGSSTQTDKDDEIDATELKTKRITP